MGWSREDIVEDADGRMVVVCDPEPCKNYLDEVQLRSKERRYAFDVVLGKKSTNRQVFETTTQQLAEGVVQVRPLRRRRNPDTGVDLRGTTNQIVASRMSESMPLSMRLSSCTCSSRRL